MVCFVFAYLIHEKKLVPLFRTTDKSFYLICFSLIALIVPIACRNWQGFAMDLFIVMILVIAMYARTLMSKRLLSHMMSISIAMSIPCVVVAAIQQLLMQGDPAFRACSTFLNANYYAMIIEFIVIFCVYRILKKPTLKRCLYYGGVTLLNLAGLFLCNCRTAWIVLFIAVPFMLLANKRYKLLGVVFALGCVLLVCLIRFPGLTVRVDDIASDFSTRASIWMTAIEGFADNPLFGQGAATFKMVVREYGGLPASHAHNIVIDLLLSYGILGTSCLFIYFSIYVQPLVQLYRTHRDKPRIIMILGLFIAVLVHGVMDITVVGMQTSLLFMLIIGYSHALSI